jgi:hypothetical protein
LNLFLLLKKSFPNLDSRFVITSPRDGDYNCIAWAAADTSQVWWPSPDGYWPVAGATEASIEAFRDAFATIGFTPAADGSMVSGIEKLALFVGSDGMVTHMARQLSDGNWTSKLGPQWDITHLTIECMTGPEYGELHSFLERKGQTQDG